MRQRGEDRKDSEEEPEQNKIERGVREEHRAFCYHRSVNEIDRIIEQLQKFVPHLPHPEFQRTIGLHAYGLDKSDSDKERKNGRPSVTEKRESYTDDGKHPYAHSDIYYRLEHYHARDRYADKIPFNIFRFARVSEYQQYYCNQNEQNEYTADKTPFLADNGVNKVCPYFGKKRILSLNAFFIAEPEKLPRTDRHPRNERLITFPERIEFRLKAVKNPEFLIIFHQTPEKRRYAR